MGYQLVEALCDLRYYIASGNVEKAAVTAQLYHGPWYHLVRAAVQHGPLPPIRIQDDILTIVGMIYNVPEYAARAHYVSDADLALELSKALELFYNRGYL